MAIVRLEGLGQLRNPMTLSGIELATFRLVALVAQPTIYHQMLGYDLSTSPNTNLSIVARQVILSFGLFSPHIDTFLKETTKIITFSIWHVHLASNKSLSSLVHLQVGGWPKLIRQSTKTGHNFLIT
jgi:hypothetical protein